MIAREKESALDSRGETRHPLTRRSAVELLVRQSQLLLSSSYRLELPCFVLTYSHQQGSVAPITYARPTQLLDFLHEVRVEPVALQTQIEERAGLNPLSEGSDHARGGARSLAARLPAVEHDYPQPRRRQPEGNRAPDDSAADDDNVGN